MDRTERERDRAAVLGMEGFLRHHNDNAEAKKENELLGNALTSHCVVAPSKAAPRPPPIFLGCGVLYGL